jgi:hypothetical protein
MKVMIASLILVVNLAGVCFAQGSPTVGAEFPVGAVSSTFGNGLVQGEVYSSFSGSPLIAGEVSSSFAVSG